MNKKNSRQSLQSTDGGKGTKKRRCNLRFLYKMQFRAAFCHVCIAFRALFRLPWLPGCPPGRPLGSCHQRAERSDSGADAEGERGQGGAKAQPAPPRAIAGAQVGRSERERVPISATGRPRSPRLPRCSEGLRGLRLPSGRGLRLCLPAVVCPRLWQPPLHRQRAV